MIEDSFTAVYSKFKLYFYQKVFDRIQNRETSLTTVETFCVEIIYVLHRPTINEFANFIKISAPNATYKINCLIKKGYLRRVQSRRDKRLFYLEVTDKFFDYYGINLSYIDTVVKRMKERFSETDISKLNEMLEIISSELMPEISCSGSLSLS
ncbi:MAG: MarR family transcriptional regulator [Oscillospiraceae bacterium]|jgi:DNA-binding MarR family transcriptional regulator|nr:MarR family transcriptional regulator [Oscillospiraceae bacterium]